MVGGVHRGQRSRERQGHVQQRDQVAPGREQGGVAHVGDDGHDLLDAHGAEPVSLGRIERELAAGGGLVVKDAVTDGKQERQVRNLDIGELRVVHGSSLSEAREGRGVGLSTAVLVVVKMGMQARDATPDSA